MFYQTFLSYLQTNVRPFARWGMCVDHFYTLGGLNRIRYFNALKRLNAMHWDNTIPLSDVKEYI